MLSRMNWVSPHIVAIALAFIYGSQIAFSKYAPTGLMFVTPLLIMLLCYWAMDAWSHGLGFSAQRVLQQSVIGSFVLLAGILVLSQVLPGPSYADASGGSSQAAMVVVCMIMLAIVVAIIAAFFYVAFLILRAIYRRFFKKTPDDNRLNDFGTLTTAVIALCVMSLEGVVGGYSFAPNCTVATTISIATSSDRVWTAMGKASSPDLKLPWMLAMLPHPVAVVEEGSAVGSKRIVKFFGREGVGEMVLQAQARIGNQQEWKVVSDTTPLKGWAQLHSVMYQVESVGAETQLTVSANYDRGLSPAWFFKPYMDKVVLSAVEVLAIDKHDRAIILAAN